MVSIFFFRLLVAGRRSITSDIQPIKSPPPGFPHLNEFLLQFPGFKSWKTQRNRKFQVMETGAQAAKNMYPLPGALPLPPSLV